MQLAPLALALTTLFIDGLRTGARRQKLHPRQAKLLEKLSEYEIVTPTRVNEFGEPFPTDVHFRRRRRSTNAAPDAWTAAASSSSPKAHYRLSAFGQQFLFNLTASSAFIAPLFTVSLLGEPAAEQRNFYAEAADADVKHCFYRGHVNARPRHTAVISLCAGMLGTFKSDDGDYFVEPLLSLEQEYEEEHNKPHLIYRHRTPPTNSSGDRQTCDTPAVSAPFFEIRCRRLRTVGKKHGIWHNSSVALGGMEQQITGLVELKVEEEEKRYSDPKKRREGSCSLRSWRSELS